MTTECKGLCRIEFQQNPKKYKFGGVTYSTHKYCHHCCYWVNLDDNQDLTCFCCRILFRKRKSITQSRLDKIHNEALTFAYSVIDQLFEVYRNESKQPIKIYT